MEKGVVDSQLSPSFDEEDDGLTQRRIRHITAIQIRNLTPFPVRDAFASALAQPAGQPQFTAHGHLSDDLDVTLSRRRSRKISVNSVNTFRSMRSEEGAGDDWSHAAGMGEPRRRTGSRLSFSGAASLGASSSGSSAGLSLPTSAAPTIRATNRHRTTSIASSVTSPFAASGSLAPSALPASANSFSSFLTMLPDNSQATLEKVIKSRLVETFIAITIPPNSTPTDLSRDRCQSAVLPQDSSLFPQPSAPPRSAPPTKEKFSASRQTPAVSNSALRTASRSSPLKPSAKSTSLRREPSSSPRPNSVKPIQKQVSNSSPRLSSKSSITARKSPAPSPPPPQPKASSHPSTPNFLSAIHRPSTNPSFSLDARSGYEFAEWTDLGANKLKIEVWGKVGSRWRSIGNISMNGKGKERALEEDVPDESGDWKVLEEWNVALSDLVPLPEDLASNTSQLPSNTLLITLSPPGQTFYLPPPRAITRTPSPSAGYTSDPESDVRKVKKVEEQASFSPVTAFPDEKRDVDIIVRSRRRHRGGGGPGDGREITTTAGWKDLFKLVTLQSCIVDNKQSLSDVVHEIDKILKEDVTSGLKRQVSEREARVEALESHVVVVGDAADQLRSQIHSRREQLQERRRLLALAKEQDGHEASTEVEREADIAKERDHLRSLRAKFTPTRTTLLTTLSTIFPIELFSSPDLLYTILNVPLPIPLAPTDPAPPLTLASHKEVTEDAVATALGFVAQVVQLLAAYLGKRLVYPVTCVGSRSLIRDGISAMLGPRMFPLYSKGVDTYRFEYGVFLLNKDIEMLMVDRDLRALDMRHTLPNLKNLLLTLTDGEGAPLRTLPLIKSPSVDSLESLPADGNSQRTPKGSPSVGEAQLPPESHTPPESGSVTPTASTPDAVRKSRAFLGLSPLADFLRVRYPSSPGWTTSVKSVPETAEEEAEESGDAAGLPNPEEQEESDEEDRRTIREVVIGEDRTQEDKKAVNGHASDEERREKLLGEVEGAVPTAQLVTS